MSNVVLAETKHLTVSDIESKKELIKRMYCKNCSDDEMELFMHACKRTGLDPFVKQIYAIKLGTTMTIMAGIDGLRLIAERTGNYSPGRESTYCYDDKGNILSATSYIKKRTSDGIWHEVAAIAYMEEYNAKKNLWLKMPRAMLAKCAESLALRKAFPAEMSGIYTKEEMDQATPELPKERTHITEEEWAILDSLVQAIDDKDYMDKLAAFVNVPSIYDILPKDFERVMKSIVKKAKEKGVVSDEPSAVA